MTPVALVAQWQALIERCVADQVTELARRRPDLDPDQLAEVTEALLRIAGRLFPAATPQAELTAGAAAVLRELLRAPAVRSGRPAVLRPERSATRLMSPAASG